jgi:hypothetical protein
MTMGMMYLGCHGSSALFVTLLGCNSSLNPLPPAAIFRRLS